MPLRDRGNEKPADAANRRETTPTKVSPSTSDPPSRTGFSAAPPVTRTKQEALRLQRVAGNRATKRLFAAESPATGGGRAQSSHRSTSPVQRVVVIGQPAVQQPAQQPGGQQPAAQQPAAQQQFGPPQAAALVQLANAQGALTQPEQDLIGWLARRGDHVQFATVGALIAHAQAFVAALGLLGIPLQIPPNAKQGLQLPAGWPQAFVGANAAGAHLIHQVPQERGDMHDVRAAMLLDPNLHVVICVTTAGGLADARIIADFYTGFGGRVKVFLGSPQNVGVQALSASQATEIILQAAVVAPQQTAATVQQAMSGHAPQTHQATYDQLLQQTFNFPQAPGGQAYLLVNYRQSGHGGTGGPRAPSHPELDTGTVGFQQLWQAAVAQGYWPVPVGQVPAAALGAVQVPGAQPFNPAQHPHLLDYWTPVHQAIGAQPAAAAAAQPAAAGGQAVPQPAPLSGRQLEYGIFVRLADQYSVRAIGMRSGGLDAIAFSGIPTISIDLATDYVPAGQGAQAGQGPQGQAPLTPQGQGLQNAQGGWVHGHGGSWLRAAKRELILPGGFHQVFMSQLRQMGNLQQAQPNWAGTLAQGDINAIAQAIDTYFGSGAQAGTGRRLQTRQTIPPNVPPGQQAPVPPAIAQFYQRLQAMRAALTQALNLQQAGAQQAGAQQLPGQQPLGQQPPGQQPPGQQPPGQQPPGQQAGAQQLPGQQPPGQQLPGQQPPGQQPPGQQPPGQQPPGQQPVGPQAPGQQPPGQQPPGQQLPGQQPPGQQPPGQQALVLVQLTQQLQQALGVRSY